MRLSLFNGKGAKSTNRGACIMVADIGSTCIKDPYTKDIGTRDVCIGSISAKGVCIVSACIDSTIAVEYLGMHLQSS